MLETLDVTEQERWGGTLLYSGRIAGRPVALADVPPGPVNAALGTQALIVRFGVGSLISFGSAGALDPRLAPGDLVIARRAIAHDAGDFLGTRFQPSGVMERSKQGRIGHRRAFDADPDLVALASTASRSLNRRTQSGTIVSGNQIIFSSARKRWLRRTFDALAVEMETAAVAQVAVAHQLPWVAVRGISDAAGDDLILDYGPLRVYLDEGWPPWRQVVRRWAFLLTHPRALCRARRLSRGLALASVQAGRVVKTLLQI